MHRQTEDWISPTSRGLFEGAPLHQVVSGAVAAAMQYEYAIRSAKGASEENKIRAEMYDRMKSLCEGAFSYYQEIADEVLHLKVDAACLANPTAIIVQSNADRG